MLESSLEFTRSNYNKLCYAWYYERCNQWLLWSSVAIYIFKKYPSEDFEINEYGIVSEKYNQLLIKVRENFSYYYGEYISAVLRDIPAVIVPLERIGRNPYLNQILNLTTIDSKSDEEFIYLSKGNSIARYFYSKLSFEEENFRRKSRCFLGEIGDYSDLLKGLKIIVLLRNGVIKLKEDVEEIKNFLKQKEIYINSWTNHIVICSLILYSINCPIRCIIMFYILNDIII